MISISFDITFFEVCHHYFVDFGLVLYNLVLSLLTFDHPCVLVVQHMHFGK